MESQQAISIEVRKAIEERFKHFPNKQSVCIEALSLVQESNRWISDKAVAELAELLEMSIEGVDSVATFYSMIYRQRVGRNVIHVCDSVSCWVMGQEKIIAYLQQKLGVAFGETSADGRFTLLPIVCLGNCDHAPTLLIEKDLYQELTIVELDALLAGYK